MIGEYEGEPLTVANGRFGPYVRHKAKYYSLPKDMDPLSCTQEQAIQLIQKKHASEEKSLLKSFAEDAELQIRDGRFGPYMKYKGENYKLPKGIDPQSLSYEDCMKIISEAPTKPARKSSARKGTTTRGRKSKA